MEENLSLEESLPAMMPSPFALVAEYASLIALLIGVVLLFRKANQPGTLMMLVGVSVYFLCTLLTELMFLYESSFENAMFVFVTYWPSLYLASILVGCIGFLRFAVSYRKEG
jgi:uncharacterized membrane protein YozB (DUF420 family)